MSDCPATERGAGLSATERESLASSKVGLVAACAAIIISLKYCCIAGGGGKLCWKAAMASGPADPARRGRPGGLGQQAIVAQTL